MTDPNGRTHEPNLREVTADLDGLRDLLLAKLDALKDVIDERDRRYSGLFEEAKEAVKSALAAQKELTNAAFSASEKAIVKAETAQTEYNIRSNEFRGQLDDQAKTLMPRAEAFARFEALDRRIDENKAATADLRESRSGGLGRADQSKYLTSVGLIIAGLFISAAVFLSRFIK